MQDDIATGWLEIANVIGVSVRTAQTIARKDRSFGAIVKTLRWVEDDRRGRKRLVYALRADLVRWRQRNRGRA